MYPSRSIRAPPCCAVSIAGVYVSPAYISTHALLFQLSSFEQFVVSMAFIVVFLVISHELAMIHDPDKCIAAGSSHVPSVRL